MTAPVRRMALTDTLPAAAFLGVYLFPWIFSPQFVASLRGTALLHLFFYWSAMGVAAALLVRADLDPAATRRRVLAAAVVLGLLALIAGSALVVAMLPLVVLLALVVMNLWDAAGAGRDALRIERAMAWAMVPCLVVAVILSAFIKPHFDHQVRSPELLTAGLLFTLLAFVRTVFTRRLV